MNMADIWHPWKTLLCIPSTLGSLLLNSELRSSPCSRNYGRDSLNGRTGWMEITFWNLPEIHYLGCQRKLFMGRWVIRGTLLQNCMWGKVSGEVAGHWVLLAALHSKNWENGEAVSALEARSMLNCLVGDSREKLLATGCWWSPCPAGARHCRTCDASGLWCWRKLRMLQQQAEWATRSQKQNHFPPCNVFPVPSTGKASVPVVKGKIFQQTRAIFTEQA